MTSGSPNQRDIPPPGLRSGGLSSSREHSRGPQDPGTYMGNPYPHSHPQAQLQQASDQYLAPPASPHSPSFGAYIPGVGSPSLGAYVPGVGSPRGGLHLGTPGSYPSPHSFSPHSLSPHSGPPLTPSPEQGGPNVTGGHGNGSLHSSPGPGPNADPFGIPGTAEMPFPMDPPSNGMLLGLGNMDMPNNGFQHSPQGYTNEPPLTGLTDDFAVALSSGSSRFPDTAGFEPNQYFGTANLETNPWQQDQAAPSIPLAANPIAPIYENRDGITGGSEAPTFASSSSIQVAPDNFNEILQYPSFWLDIAPDRPLQSQDPGHMGDALGANWNENINAAPNLLIDMQTQPPPPSLQSQSPGAFQYHQTPVDAQAVPPPPAKGTLPWDGMSGLPPGGMTEWQRQPVLMQSPNVPQHDSTQIVPNNLALHLHQHPTAFAVPPPRPMPRRQRSKSETYNNPGQFHPPQPSSSPSIYAHGQVHTSPKKHSDTLTDGHTMSFGGRQEDVIIGTAGGPGFRLARPLPFRGHRQTISEVPSFLVIDYDTQGPPHPHDLHHQPHQNHQHPNLPLTVPQPHQGLLEVLPDKSPLPENYGPPRRDPMIYLPGGHPPTVPQPPLPPAAAYSQFNSSPSFSLGGPASLARSNSSSKQKQQGQRSEVDQKKLREAFTPASRNPDPALRLFLDTIFRCSFYEDDRLEPVVGTKEAEQLLAQVRSHFPEDPRFHPRHLSPAVDSEARDAQSIFMLFTENNQCLICGSQKDRTGRALGHVRSDLGHRPYHCNCEKCAQSAKYVFPPFLCLD